MQRGVLIFTPQHQQAIHAALQQMPTSQPELVAKMAPQAEMAQVELSEDEAEQILDSLPAPTTDGDPAANELRTMVQNFLGKLRGTN